MILLREIAEAFVARDWEKTTLLSLAYAYEVIYRRPLLVGGQPAPFERPLVLSQMVESPGVEYASCLGLVLPPLPDMTNTEGSRGVNVQLWTISYIPESPAFTLWDGALAVQHLHEKIREIEPKGLCFLPRDSDLGVRLGLSRLIQKLSLAQ